jgi:hypothetical protein
MRGCSSIASNTGAANLQRKTQEADRFWFAPGRIKLNPSTILKGGMSGALKLDVSTAHSSAIARTVANAWLAQGPGQDSCRTSPFSWVGRERQPEPLTRFIRSSWFLSSYARSLVAPAQIDLSRHHVRMQTALPRALLLE